MNSSVKVVDKMPQFKKSLYVVLDDALKEGARDIMIKAKNKAPFSKGGLRSDSDITRPRMLHYRVNFYKEYARFQEFGGDSKRVVRQYSTSGTGKGYLKSAGDEISSKISRTLSKHSKRART